jgi:hypothetical protein
MDVAAGGAEGIVAISRGDLGARQEKAQAIRGNFCRSGGRRKVSAGAPSTRRGEEANDRGISDVRRVRRREWRSGRGGLDR